MKKASNTAILKQVDALEAEGKFAEAAQLLADATKRLPKDARLSARLVLLYSRRLPSSSRAATEMARLLKLAPKSPTTHELAAEIAFNLKGYDQAKKHADEMLRLGTTSPDGLYIAATIYQKFGLHDQTNLCLQEALRLRPNHLQARLLHAMTLRTIGKLTEAEAISRQIFDEYPDNITNYNIWTLACRQTADDPMYLHLRDVIEPILRKQNDPKHHLVLGMLGRAENDIGNYEKAFSYFTEGKTLKAVSHDREVNARYVGHLKTTTSRSNYFGWNGHTSEVPVLIVGMPRTESTLMEQILASHPQIGGIGESGLFRSIAMGEGLLPRNGQSLEKLIKEISPDRAQKLATFYLENSSRENKGKPRIVDKNLHNF